MRALLLLLVVAWLAGCTREPPLPGERVDVGGHRLYITCSGPAAGPTVIFESGLGGVTELFYWLQQGTSQQVRSCAYDRAGLGWSDASDAPHDAGEIADQLHLLLQASHVPGPYVLVGHSMAGLIMPVYTARYPDEVAGLVFLDPTVAAHIGTREWETASRQLQWFYRGAVFAAATGLTHLFNPMDLALESGWKDAYPADVQARIGALEHRTRFYRTMLDERDAIEQSARQALAVRTLGDRPVLVVTAGRIPPTDDAATLRRREEAKQRVRAGHAAIAALSTRGRHIVFPQASHISLVTARESAEQLVPLVLEVVRDATR